jgi:hypothetical protein
LKITELRLIKYIRLNPARTAAMVLAGISGLVCGISTAYHYTSQYYGNPVSWISWLTGMLFLLAAFFPAAVFRTSLPEKIARMNRKDFFFFSGLSLFVIGLYFFNFRTAPWNQNGLFDDAAWDLYFMKRYIFSGVPFQAAFFDGGVSREVIYHYYLYPFFKIFGYNLLIFKIALMVLGLTTILFTSMLIRRLTKSYWATAMAAVVFSLLPFQYVHTFEGHRYAMAYPLMAASFYLLYTGFKNKAPFRVVLSAILAALLMDSAIMGKQYLICLFGAWVISMIFHYRKFFNRSNWNNAKLFGFSLIVAMMPLIIYIYFNPIYFAHETDMTNQFLTALQNGGLQGIETYINNTREVFFGSFTYLRRFNFEFVPLPFAYYIFLLPGFLIALFKKRYELFFLALLPVVAAFISGIWDFRFLHAVPFWIILMALTFKTLMDLFDRISFFRKKTPPEMDYSPPIEEPPLQGEIPPQKESPLKGEPKKVGRYWAIGLMTAVLLFGLVPSVEYLYGKSKDPNSIFQFPQSVVAVSRYLRDVVAGVLEPSPKMRWQELNKLKGYPESGYDTLICQNYGYAITHLFLKDYGDEKIMALSDQLPFNLLTEAEILGDNLLAIQNYQKTNKDLKLIWEIDEKTKRIIELFKQFNYMGSDQILASSHAGINFSFYVLNIKNDRIDEFKEWVQGLKLPD